MAVIQHVQVVVKVVQLALVAIVPDVLQHVQDAHHVQEHVIHHVAPDVLQDAKAVV